MQERNTKECKDPSLYPSVVLRAPTSVTRTMHCVALYCEPAFRLMFHPPLAYSDQYTLFNSHLFYQKHTCTIL